MFVLLVLLQIKTQRDEKFRIRCNGEDSHQVLQRRRCYLERLLLEQMDCSHNIRANKIKTQNFLSVHQNSFAQVSIEGHYVSSILPMMYLTP